MQIINAISLPLAFDNFTSCIYIQVISLYMQHFIFDFTHIASHHSQTIFIFIKYFKLMFLCHVNQSQTKDTQSECSVNVGRITKLNTGFV